MAYNPFSLEGKSILVTGASSGIGRATAIECSKLGAQVIISGRNAERLHETFNALEGEGHEQVLADLTVAEQLDSLIAGLPVLDGLVNNAGITETLPVQFATKEKIENVLSVNTYAPVLLYAGMLKNRKLARGASVVFTSSLSGNKIVFPGNSLYSLSKGAISAFMRNAALEAAPRGIRVNAVLPGMIETHIYDQGILTKEDLARDALKYPLKRYGKPEEVAWGIIYLLSDASSFTVGSSLIMDGGYILS